MVRIENSKRTILNLAESMLQDKGFNGFSYAHIANELGVTLIDLNEAKPYADFKETVVGPNSFFYNTFIFNQLLLRPD